MEGNLRELGVKYVFKFLLRMEEYGMEREGKDKWLYFHRPIGKCGLREEGEMKHE